MPSPQRLYSFRFVLVLGLQFAFGLGFSSFFLLPKYLTEVHAVDAGVVGRIMAAGPVSAVLVIPLLARIIERVRRHYLLLAAAVSMGAAALGFTRLDELHLGVYVLRALQGAAFTAYMSTGAALIVELAPPARLGQALGLLGSANLVTNAIGPGIAEPLAQTSGWNAVFLLSALCSLVAGVGTLALAEPARGHFERHRALNVPGARQTALLYASMVVGISFGTIITFYQPLALELGIEQVRDLFIGYTLTALAVRVLFGAWLDRLDRRHLAIAASSLYAAVVFATGALERGWLFPLGLGLGLAHGALYPSLSALFIEGTPARGRGALMTYFGGAFNVGMVLSTLGFGIIAGAVGIRSVFALAGVLAVSGVVALARLRS